MEKVEFADLVLDDRFRMVASHTKIVHDVTVIIAPHHYFGGQMLRVKIAFEDGSTGYAYGHRSNDLRERS